jgi:hypothetical protein
MKKATNVWLILLAATLCICWLSAPTAAHATRIKVENAGSSLAQISKPSSAQSGYDPYFIPANDVPHLPIPTQIYQLKQNEPKTARALQNSI